MAILFNYFFLFCSGGWGWGSVAEHMKAALMQILVSVLVADTSCRVVAEPPVELFFFGCDIELIEDDLADNDSADSAGPFPLFLSGLPCFYPLSLPPRRHIHSVLASLPQASL